MKDPRCVTCKHQFAHHNDFNERTLYLGCDLCSCEKFTDIVVRVITLVIHVAAGVAVIIGIFFYLFLWKSYRDGVLF